MAVSHVKSNTIADKTGTITIWDGATTASVAATDVIRPTNWNSAHNQFFTLSGNTSLSSTASGTNVIYSAAGPALTLIGSSDSIIFSTPPHISSYQNITPFAGSITTSMAGAGASISHCGAFNLPEPGSFSFIRIPMSFTTGSTAVGSTGATLSASVAITTTWNAAVYSLQTGANSRSLTLVASGSCTWVAQNQINVAVNGTQYSETMAFSGFAEGAGTTRTTSTARSTSTIDWSSAGHQSEFSGNRFCDINFANSLSAGAYWLIWGFSTSSSANSTGVSAASQNMIKYSYHHVASGNIPFFGVMGSTNLTSVAQFGMGSFSTAGGGTTANLPISAISSMAANNFPIFQMLRSA